VRPPHLHGALQQVEPPQLSFTKPRNRLDWLRGFVVPPDRTHLRNVPSELATTYLGMLNYIHQGRTATSKIRRTHHAQLLQHPEAHQVPLRRCQQHLCSHCSPLPVPGRVPRHDRKRLPSRPLHPSHSRGRCLSLVRSAILQGEPHPRSQLLIELSLTTCANLLLHKKDTSWQITPSLLTTQIP
jgi:hypothetical protein